MVNAEEQTITLDKYSTKPTYQVGFVVDEDFVTPVEDPGLKDNAQGHSNFAAPGADRLRITLNLLKRKEADTEQPNFIPIVNLVQGNVVGNPSQSIKWDWLYDILAKRTFDESGDYLITEFPIKMYEYYNTDIVDGVFDADPDTYGDSTPYPPVPGSGETTPLTLEQADGKYAIQVSPGEGYVQGYNVGYVTPFYVYGDKPRKLSFTSDTFTQVNPGVFVKVTNTFNTPDIENIKENYGNAEAFSSITTYRNFTDGHVGTGFVRRRFIDDTEEGQQERRPDNIGNEPLRTFHVILSSFVIYPSMVVKMAKNLL